jgi:tight adherence protein B
MRRRRAVIVLAALAASGLVPAGALGAGVEARLNAATKWPQRELVLSLPAKRALENGNVKLRENGVPIAGVKVTPESANRKRGVMLVIDSSLTMTGEPIRQAMVAARSFARRRGENTPMGIVFFSKQPRVALAPTTDPLRIRTSLAVAPGLSRGTRIYDAAAAGIEALRTAGLTSGAIVILSDGAEAIRGSSTTPEELATLAGRTNVRIFSVGLNSASFNATSLRSIADATGGRYGQAARPRDLPPLFAAIGDRLSSEYLVSYNSTSPAGAAVRVSTRIDGFPGTTIAKYDAPALPALAAPSKHASDASGLDSTRVFAIAIICFSLLAFVMYLMLRPGRRSVIDRVSDFAGDSGPEALPTLADVRREPRRKPSDRWQRYADTVELADIRLSAEGLALLTAGGTFLLATYFAVIGRPAFMVVALVVPFAVRAFVLSRVKKRRRAFEDQLPDNLQVLASALRAGYSFSAGLASMADDAPEPSRTEIRRASTDEQLGIEVSDALRAVAERMDSDELEYVGIVARMQREAGGNTAEVLDQVIETIRSRQQLRREVRTLTAQGRFGGLIISVMPIVVAVAMAIIHPGYFDPMLSSAIGVGLIFLSVLMLGSGWLVIRKVVDVEP